MKRDFKDLSRKERKETMLEKIFNVVRDEWRGKLVDLDRFGHSLGIEIIDNGNIYELTFRFYETEEFDEKKYQLLIEGKNAKCVNSGYVACSTPDLIDYFIGFSQKAVGFILGETKALEK